MDTVTLRSRCTSAGSASATESATARLAVEHGHRVLEGRLQREVEPPASAMSAPTRGQSVRAGERAPANSPTRTVALAASQVHHGELGVVGEGRGIMAGGLGLGDPELHAVHECIRRRAAGIFGVGDAAGPTS